MDRYPKKRIEIIVESPMLRRVTDVLDKMDATGYTVIPAIAGKGQQGGWTREGTISDTERMVMVMCITDPSRVDEVLEAVFNLVARQIGIVSVSDVEVFRSDHF